MRAQAKVFNLKFPFTENLLPKTFYRNLKNSTIIREVCDTELQNVEWSPIVPFESHVAEDQMYNEKAKLSKNLVSVVACKSVASRS
jgi:hypothetical protein